MLGRWERVLIALAVCLPVPIFAATGLSIPLPSTVERLAAALVPWADPASFESDDWLTVGADGAIVLASHEVAGVQTAVQPTRAIADRPHNATSGEARPGKEDGAEGGGTASGGNDGTSSGPTDGGSSGGGSSGGGSSGSGSSGDDTGGTSGPIETVVEEAGSATQPVVDAVEETVDDPAGTVGGVVEDVDETAGGLLPVGTP